ncbi:hypothetical protein, partial [Ralstonia solanacearum]
LPAQALGPQSRPQASASASNARPLRSAHVLASAMFSLEAQLKSNPAAQSRLLANRCIPIPKFVLLFTSATGPTAGRLAGWMFICCSQLKDLKISENQTICLTPISLVAGSVPFESTMRNIYEVGYLGLATARKFENSMWAWSVVA